MNAYYSGVVLLAGSDKSVTLFDMARGAVLLFCILSALMSPCNWACARRYWGLTAALCRCDGCPPFTHASSCVACYGPAGRFTLRGACVVPGCPARVIADSTARTAHSVVIPSASGLAGLSPQSLDVFALATLDGGLFMWDLRAPSVVRTFGGHVSRSYHTGAAFSPCMRYIASGSEDRVGALLSVSVVATPFEPAAMWCLCSSCTCTTYPRARVWSD